MSTLELTGPEPLALPQRLLEAARALVFLISSLAFGLLCVVAVPVAVAGGPAALHGLLELERTLANRLLAARIPAPQPVSAETEIDWRQVAFVLGKLPLVAAAALVCAVPAALVVGLLVLAAEGLAGSTSYLGPWRLGPLVGLMLLLLTIPALLLCVGALTATGSLLARLSRTALARTTPVGGAVREALAERLGDRTLAIAYWLPDRELFVDERGHPVPLPEPGSGRSWTAVEHHGRRVAAIVHDVELEARPELVEAAAAGAVLALENEQLKADLRARLEELRASRKRIVAASVEARRKLERDLHDGAQQQLISLALDLQLLRGRIADEPTRALVDDTLAKLSGALTELRELARGIHPALLNDRGLPPALESLAERSPVPVELHLELERRLPIGVEAAVYFLAAEALTNVAKYAHATHARVSVSDTDGELRLEVADDGIGGADPTRGSGLRGLSDRIAALDGQFVVDSPAGGGTRVAATVPYRDAAE